jgi:hypothetical protein
MSHSPDYQAKTLSLFEGGSDRVPRAPPSVRPMSLIALTRHGPHSNVQSRHEIQIVTSE